MRVGSAGRSSPRPATSTGSSGSTKRGATGVGVKHIQRALNHSGHGLKVDGKFGPKTDAAVRRFQEAHGLKVDGIVGPKTLGAMQASLSDTRRRAEPVARNAEPVTRNEPGTNRTASLDSYSKKGQRNQMATGRVTINGNTYTFRSGGSGRGNLPKGDYKITPHLWSRNDRSMNVGGVGYSFAMSDKYDARVGGTRTLLRIHPDGGGAGTLGCMGIVGDAATQRRFREDMRAELQRAGGAFTLNVR